jgi:hypothetical protein
VGLKYHNPTSESVRTGSKITGKMNTWKRKIFTWLIFLNSGVQVIKQFQQVILAE